MSQCERTSECGTRLGVSSKKNSDISSSEYPAENINVLVLQHTRGPH